MKYLLWTLVFFAGPAVAGERELPEVSGVFSYQCEATFFEGEGVSPNQVSCPAFQHLGILSANYTHYLYASDHSDNFDSKGQDEWYSSTICNRAERKVYCSHSEPMLEYGLAADQDDRFVVSVSYTASRGVNGGVYGYAALPERNGRCAPDLIPVWPFVAQPQSQYRPLPSSFVNYNGNLNDWQLSTRAPDAFEVLRQANRLPCDGVGDCSGVRLSTPVVAQRISYQRTNQMVCVIPPERIRDQIRMPRLAIEASKKSLLRP